MRQKTNNMQEIWKDIEFYEGYYQVSNLGNVKSLARTVPFRKSFRIIQEKLLKVRKEKSGYQVVSFYINGVEIKKKVHRLVAEAFIENKKNKLQVNHIDGNKMNNFVNNLEWVTPSENIIHSYKNNLQAKKRPKKFIINYSTGIFYNGINDLLDSFDFKKSTIMSKLNGQRKNDTTFKYV